VTICAITTDPIDAPPFRLERSSSSSGLPERLAAAQRSDDPRGRIVALGNTRASLLLHPDLADDEQAISYKRRVLHGELDLVGA